MALSSVIDVDKPDRTDGSMMATLAAEANHRIANHLALLAAMVRLHSRHLPDEEAMPVDEVRRELAEIGARIETVGRLHGLLAVAPERGDIDLQLYLREVAQIAIASFGDRADLSLSLSPGCVTSHKEAGAIGLMVGEAIINALKYAHPTGVRGVIDVACRSEPKRGLVIEIADDGIGLPEDFDPMASDALGLRLLRSLTAQLAARLEFDQSGIGLCVRVVIPQRPHIVPA